MKLSDIIIFESDDFIVLNKPAGLLSIPDREGKEVSLKKILQERFGTIFTIHRLDKGTSGVILFGKNEHAHQYFSQQFQDRGNDKFYLGLVLGSPKPAAGSINSRIKEHPSRRGLMKVDKKGKEAFTEYQVLKDFGRYAWVQFKIFTGRTHQIRVHMKELGHPIVCDELYGDGNPILLSSLKHRFKLSKSEEEERPILNRLALHASQWNGPGPDGRDYRFEAPLPKDLTATLRQLDKISQRRPGK